MTEAFQFSDTLLVGDREPSFIPGSHAASKDTHNLKAFPSQDLCRSDRAAFLVSNGDDCMWAMSFQIVKLFVEFG